MSISVAMTTYKGARYIEAQLESILAQTLPPDEIVICDDNSPDDTAAIIRRIAASSSVPIHLHVNPENLGVIQNFARAISLCTSDYIALSDQDDVWLPEKIAICHAAMQDAEATLPPHTPVLLHTDLQLVDADLTPTHPSFLAYTGLKPHIEFPLKRLMIQNYITGCTAYFNRALIQVALPIPPEAVIHDHWLALMAAATGTIKTLPQVTILYRQHGNNQIGARKTPLLKQILNIHKLDNLHAKGRQLIAMARVLSHLNPVPASQLFIAQTAKNLSNGGLRAIWFCQKQNIMPSSLLGHAYFCIQLMLVPLLHPRPPKAS